MEQQTLYRLISENIHKIYAWSFAKVYQKQDAEDLAEEIICDMLEAGERIKKDDAFFGYLWRLANHKLCGYIRRKQRAEPQLSSEFFGNYWPSAEETVQKQEQLDALRRELSLLSGRFREVTVQYYLYGKTCSQIAASLGVSVETVKYDLFQARKALKEGIEMKREFGEKSYAPGVFRPDFWGGNNSYQALFNRKLPGNILLAAFPAALTLSELSGELGVASVYMEDEINILLENELLRKVGNRYQTGIVIFTDLFEREMLEKNAGRVKSAADQIASDLQTVFPQICELTFHGKGKDDNTLKWQLLNVAMVTALQESDQYGIERFGPYPRLSNGSYGFVYGFDNDYIHHLFNGIYGDYENKEKTAWISVENYRIIEDVQHFVPRDWNASMDALVDASLERSANEGNDELIRLIKEGYINSENGTISANFAVFPESLFRAEVNPLLGSIRKTVFNCMRETGLFAGVLLSSYQPKPLIAAAKRIAYIKYQMDTMALIFDQLLHDGILEKPREKMMPCMFAVVKKKNNRQPETVAD